MRNLLLSLFAVLLVAHAVPAQGKVFMTTDEALKLAFPKCKIERVTRVLDDKKKQLLHKLSGHKATRSMVYAYQAKKDGKLVGTAYFDRHRVRSKQELLMIVVTPECKVKRIEIISFGEPTDYLPRGNFYAQLYGRCLKDDLSTKGEIRGVVGCTLTVNATIAAVKRILAKHQLVFPEQFAKAQVSAEKKKSKGKPKAKITTS